MSTTQWWRPPVMRNRTLAALSTSPNLIIFDCETTGLHPDKDSMIQFGSILFRFSPFLGKWEKKDELDLYINPGFHLPVNIIELTGITDSKLAGMPGEKEVIDKILSFLAQSDVWAGYNVGFDIGFVEETAKRAGKEMVKAPYVLDVLEMARDLVSYEELGEFKHSYKQENITKYLGMGQEVYHSAIEDCKATANLLFFFSGEYMEKWLEEKKEKRIIPAPYRVWYYEGYRGMSKVCVGTDQGTFCYSIRKRRWEAAEKNPVDLGAIDMPMLRKAALSLAGARDDEEFSKIRGSIEV